MSMVSIGYILFVDVITAIIGVGILIIGVQYHHIKNEGENNKGSFNSIIEGLKYVKGHKFIKRFLTYYAIITVLTAPIRNINTFDGNTYFWR